MMVVRLLEDDAEEFELRFSEAAHFIRDALVRYECYRLFVTKHQRPPLNEFDQARLAGLLRHPACYLGRFAAKIRREFGAEVKKESTDD